MTSHSKINVSQDNYLSEAGTFSYQNQIKSYHSALAIAKRNSRREGASTRVSSDPALKKLFNFLKRPDLPKEGFYIFFALC